MRKVFYFMIVLTTIITSFLFVSCGDSEDDNGQIDMNNFIIQNGKRLSELSYIDTDSTLSYIIDTENNSFKLGLVPNNQVYNYKIKYDSKGRMNKIYNTRKDSLYLTCEIDYEQRCIKRLSKQFIYSLNEDGYISQIDNGYFFYNEKGYLINFDNANFHSIFDYDHYNIKQASLEEFKTGLIHAYFISIENSDKRELYIRFKTTNGYKTNLNSNDLIGIIAVFSGLFGKIPSNFLVLKSEDEVNALFGIDKLYNDQYKTIGRFILKYE